MTAHRSAPATGGTRLLGTRRGQRPLGRLDLFLVGALIIVAGTTGGGVSLFPLGDMVAQLLGVALLARLLFVLDWSNLWRSARWELAFLAALVAVPVIQLVPLPPGLWRSLPGRELPASVLDFLGAGSEWHPISLDPESTVYAALALIPAFALFLGVLRASVGQIRIFAGLVVALALAGGTVAILQDAGWLGPLFPDVEAGYQAGLFVNRSHQPDLLIIGFVMASAAAAQLPRHRSGAAFALVSALCLFIAACVVSTVSRMGFLLFVLGMLATVIFVFRFRSGSVARSLSLLALCVAALVAFSFTDSGSRLVHRLTTTEELRIAIWGNTLDAIVAYAPVGSGLGTFNLVYEPHEDLEDLFPGWVPSAHNDYLQLLVETGLAGALLIGLFLWWFVRRTIQLGRSSGAILGRAAAVSAFVPLLHSLVDYPLRNTGLLALFGLLVGVMAREALSRTHRGYVERRRRGRRHESKAPAPEVSGAAVPRPYPV